MPCGNFMHVGLVYYFPFTWSSLIFISKQGFKSIYWSKYEIKLSMLLIWMLSLNKEFCTNTHQCCSKPNIKNYVMKKCKNVNDIPKKWNKGFLGSVRCARWWGWLDGNCGVQKTVILSACVSYITSLSVYGRKKVSVFCMKQTMAAYTQRAEITLTLNKCNNNIYYHFVHA